MLHLKYHATSVKNGCHILRDKLNNFQHILIDMVIVDHMVLENVKFAEDLEQIRDTNIKNKRVAQAEVGSKII